MLSIKDSSVYNYLPFPFKFGPLLAYAEALRSQNVFAVFLKKNVFTYYQFLPFAQNQKNLIF